MRAMARDGSPPMAFRFVLPFLLVGCGAEDTDLTKVTDLSWDASEVAEVVVSQERGDLSFEAGWGDQAEARVTRSCSGKDESEAQRRLDAVQLTDHLAQGRLSVLSAPGTGCEVTLDFVLPTEVHVEAWTNEGSVDLAGLEGGARLRAEDGDVEVLGAAGGLDVEVGTGDLTVVSHSGGVSAAVTRGTVDCDIQILADGDEVDLVDAAGNVDLRLPPDASCEFDAMASPGWVTIDGFDAVSLSTDEQGHKAGIIGDPPVRTAIAVRAGSDDFAEQSEIRINAR